ncbi:hypothetical protein [Streptomyces sp. NPDC059788]|uniref:hypothetical protein n=1 Tax=Streptomyces sp. NPDC059788 TaxID=3346948 RepID=UPI00366746AE
MGEEAVVTALRTSQEGAVECAGCAELARALVVALKAGDLSKVTDCQVLIRRHPDHGGPPADGGTRPL